MSSASLELSGLTRRFGDHIAVDDLSLAVNSGELVALVGASGSGKTTTLRMVAGYERPDAGRVLLDGKDITGVPPQGRGFGMVFQHYALFPHMSVQDNVAFGLEARGVARGERRQRARTALETVGLSGKAERPVQSLSGGEQQRVAMARAIVIQPRVLLLDEPLSNLDPTLRRSMRDELRQMLRTLSVTALFVTHDQEDAFAVADRVALLRNGRLMQVGRPEELYQRPANREVAAFIGKAALVPARIDGPHALITVGEVTQFARFAVDDDALADNWLAVLRPELLALRPDDGDTAHWKGTVLTSRFAGAVFSYQVRLEGDLVLEIVSPLAVAGEGEAVRVSLRDQIVALVSASA